MLRFLQLVAIAAVLAIALAILPGHSFAAVAAEGQSPLVQTGATLGISASIFGIVALIRKASPDMTPLGTLMFVFALSTLFVVAAAFSAGGSRDPITILLTIASQAMGAIGFREVTVAGNSAIRSDPSGG